MGNLKTVFSKFIGNFNTENFVKKVDALSDSEQDQLCESLIQDFNNSGGGGVVQRHESNYVDFLEIFFKTCSSSHKDISLSKNERDFCFKVANRLELSGVDANKAIDLSIENRGRINMNVNELVKELVLIEN